MLPRFRLIAALLTVLSVLAALALVRVRHADGAHTEAPLPLDVAGHDAELSAHLEFVRIDSRALAGNLLGDPATRELGILLPPSYYADARRTFPVVYLLHGVGQRRDGHLDNVGVQRAAFRQMAAGNLPEFILVAVDGSTSLGGSYYASSPTIGDFGAYVVREVVSAVDARYRTRPQPEFRALAGFSMGGHGALKLALKHPGIFSEVGTLSASPLSLAERRHLYHDAVAGKPVARSAAELRVVYPFDTAWTVASIYAKAAAFSPAPSRGPLFLQLPFQTSRPDGRDPVWEQWFENDPLTLLTRHPDALRALVTLYMDRGDRETILGADAFDQGLARYGYRWRHTVFPGGHADDYQDRHLRMFHHLAAAWVPRS